MGVTLQLILLAAAAASAAVLGWLLWQGWCSWRARVRYRAALFQQGEAPDAQVVATADGSSVEERVVAYACQVEKRLSSVLFRPWSPLWLRNRRWDARAIAQAGLEGRLSASAFWESRVRLAVGAAAIGAAVGVIVSVELGCLLAVAGLVAGWRVLPWAIGRRSAQRAERMERHLSEMLDVVALGMRSGMSFDRSLHLYTTHFPTLLAESFACAHRQWSCGLTSRPDALRAVAASYASPLLDRVVENVIRSLRFGATLADNLEDAAREARAAFSARKQEQVAKAPVKMMVPTGALILPAMLILVLGPVLLELAGGF